MYYKTDAKLHFYRTFVVQKKKGNFPSFVIIVLPKEKSLFSNVGMTDPIADYEEFLKKGEGKKAAAIEALRQKLKEQKAEVKKTEDRIADLEGRAAGPERKRKRSGYVMTEAHKAKMRAGRKKTKKRGAK